MSGPATCASWRTPWNAPSPSPRQSGSSWRTCPRSSEAHCQPPWPPAESAPWSRLERDYILAALEFNRGNQTVTARQLGIGAATLYRKLKSYGALARDRS